MLTFSDPMVTRMSAEEKIRAKLFRLEELRKYQSYYGPNTPYPVVLEINDLEIELRRLLQTGPNRQNHSVKKKKRRAKKPAAKKKNKVTTVNKPNKKQVPLWQFWRLSQPTFDAIVTIAFLAFIFLLGTILFAAYVNTRPGQAAVVGFSQVVDVRPTLRPTFTATPDKAAVAPVPAAQVVAVEESNLPPAERLPTEVATSVPTLTPTPTAVATETPLPTDTPVPTSTRPPAPTATPAPPTATPAPSFPFAVTEQGNRAFQRTSYHVITVYIAVVSEGNIPLGGYKVIADHSSGQHIESSLSDWNWSVTNCLDCGYIKQGNLKMDLGPFADGVWNLYLADPGGARLSPSVPLGYSTDPEQWVWDFVIFKRKDG